MSELKKITKSVPSGGMERPASSGGNSGHIIRTPPKPEMERPFVAEGTLDGFGKWTLDDAGLLVINGKGEMPDDWIRGWASVDNPTPWGQRGKAGAIKQVHISDGVTSIGSAAFYNCKSLTSIHIPDSVTRIWGEAFRNCESLTSIHIPYGVNRIGMYAFCDCKSLTDIHIPSSVIKIGDSAFSNCDNLRQVTMPRRFNRPLFLGFCDLPISFKEYFGIPKRIVTFI